MPVPLLVIAGEASNEVQALGDELLLDAGAVRAATGWEVKAHGLCQGDVCIAAQLGTEVSLADLAATLGRPVALERLEDRAVAVLGEPGATTLRAGDQAPSLTLPDVDGNPVHISGSGRKTALVAWSTWCGCRYELPAWLELARELAGDGLDIVTVALDEDTDAVRKWTSRVPELPTAIDAEHRVSDVFGVVNVPSTVWLDEQGRVVKPPTIAPGDDRFVEFTEVESSGHHDALRAWVRGGPTPDTQQIEDTVDLRAARAERRLAAWLYRRGYASAAERHFIAAVQLAPLDFSIRRASMPLRGQDPFTGPEFVELWQDWSAAGRPGYTPTVPS